jgi:hypothetical protein
VRNAVDGSNPPLCNTHRVVFADIGRTPARVPGQAAVDLLGDLLSGQKVSRDRVQDAINDLLGGAWQMGGGMAGGYYPEDDGAGVDTEWTPHNSGGPHDRRHHRHASSFDPEAAELAEARRRARIVMGFAASERITLEQLRVTYKKLARKHHPDLGGDREKMTQVNAANDVLEAELTT